MFDAVRTAAKAEPVQVSDEVYNALQGLKDLQNTGARVPRAALKLASRLGEDRELYWDEARHFYTNISRMSANEYNNLAPQTVRAVGQLGRALGDTLQANADSVGQGDNYQQAMQLWARSKGWQQFGSDAWNSIKRAVGPAIGGAIGGGIGARLASDIAT